MYTRADDVHHVESRPTSMIGISQYADDMTRMGAIEFAHFTHGRRDDIHHSLGCPGCAPNGRSNPAFAVWFALDAKWQGRGEPPACPIERQAWFNARYRDRPWWVEARDSVAHYRPKEDGRAA